jgi:hypothetical protein
LEKLGKAGKGDGGSESGTEIPISAESPVTPLVPVPEVNEKGEMVGAHYHGEKLGDRTIDDIVSVSQTTKTDPATGKMVVEEESFGIRVGSGDAAVI